MLILNAETAREINSVIVGIYDDRILPLMKRSYDHVMALGENKFVDETTTKLKNVQTFYNDVALPENEKIMAEMSKLSNLSEMMAAVQGDTSINGQLAGEIKTGNFDAAAEL